MAQSTSVGRIVAYVVVVAVIGAGMYVMLQPESAGTPIGEQEETAADMQSYSNELYGISFTYPNSYILSERDAAGSGLRGHHMIILMDKIAAANIPVGGEGPTSINIDIFQNNLDNLTIDQWVTHSSASNFKLSPDGELRNTTIAGRPALSYTWDGLYRADSAVLAHKENIVMFSSTWLTPTDTIRDDFSALLQSVEFR